MNEMKSNSANTSNRSHLVHTLAWIGMLLLPMPSVVYEALVRSRLDSIEPSWKVVLWILMAAFYTIAAFGIIGHRWDFVCRMPGGWWKILWMVIPFGLVTLGWISSQSLLLTAGWSLGVGNFLLFQQEKTSQRSLFYLWPMTWIVIRWPDVIDQRLIEWAMNCSSQIASLALDQLGVTYRLWQSELETEFGSLSIRSLMFEDAPWLWLCGLGALYVCWKSQSIWSIPLSATMAVLWTIVAYAMQLAWIGWNVAAESDLKWSEPAQAAISLALGLVCLSLFISTEHLWSSLLAPIDDGESISKENPLVLFWNRRIANFNGKSTQRSSIESARRISAENDKVAPRRQFELRRFLGMIWEIPIYLERTGSFFVRWISSRQWRTLAIAIPAIVTSGISVSMWLFANHSNRSYQRIERLEELLSHSLEKGEYGVANLAARSLLDQRPENLEYQFAFASLLDQRGDGNGSRKEMERMAIDHRHGLSAMWIIGKDFELASLKKWSEYEHRQFRSWMEIALEDLDGENLQSAKVLMFSYLTEVGAYREATGFIEDVIPSKPEMALAAASLYRSLQKPRTQIAI